MAPGNSAPWPRLRRWSWWTTLLIVTLTTIDCVSAAKKPEAAGPATKVKEESVIEEVTAKQLERVLNEKDFVAVFWCKWSSYWRVLCVHVPVCSSPSRPFFLLTLQENGVRFHHAPYYFLHR